MINLNISSASLAKTFLILIALLFMAEQKTAAQGWETFIGSPDENLEVNKCWQSSSMGDGNYLAYNSRNGGTGDRSIQIHRLNAFGEIGWTLDFPQATIISTVYDPILSCGNDEFVTAYKILPSTGGNPWSHTYMVKFDGDGNTLWEHELFPGNDENTDIISWINAPDGGIYFHAYQGIQPSQYYFGKISCEGNLEFFNQLPWPMKLFAKDMFYIGNELYVSGRQIYPFSSGEISYAKVESDSTFSEPIVFEDFTPNFGPMLSDDNAFLFIDSGEDQIIQIKTNLLGTILSEDVIYDNIEISSLAHLFHVGDGLITTGSRDAIGPNGEITGFAMKSNFNGELVWANFFDHRNSSNRIYSAINAHGGGYILSGKDNNQGYVIKVDEMGNIYSNSLIGNVSRDIDLDCDTSAVDIPIANWLVTAEKAGDTFIGSTDSMGNYFIPVDTGSYVVSCHYPNDYWTSCSNDSLVIIPDFDNEININYSISGLVECPQMTIDGNTPFLRPCFDRPAFFQYCNQGTITAIDARIEITVDPAITATTSSTPWTSQVGNTYIFELGDLAPLACGNFTMSLFLDCDASIGNAYSVKAQAFPDTLCTPPHPLYSGAFIELSGICDDEEIIFTIKNVGDQPMDNPVPYIIVEDAVLGYANDVQLLAGGLVDIPVSSNGSTYTLLASQVANAPGDSNPLLVLEGCGTNEQGEYSIGFSNQFGLDDGLPSCDLDLVEARNSFDPNAKSAYPEGYSSSHYIRPNTPLEYFLYFQNTGSDTAFTVVLRDTLDQWLDLSSLEAGASSHVYSYSFEGHRTLKFTFDDINLPDSTTNQLGSNGYVSFKIKPKSSTPLSTVIKNQAAIYFDYNEPIITNETFHTIAEDFIEVIIDDVSDVQQANADIIIRPNPFIDETHISIQNHEANSYQIRVYDLQGRLVRQETHEDSDIAFRKKGLIGGVYIYEIISDEGLVVTGRMVVR